MSKRTDYYKILGVAKSATADEIKRAYRRLAKQYHPDRNPDDPSAETKFKDVQNAYQVLSDPTKRAEYDRFGEAGVGNVHTGPNGQRVYQWGSNSTINVDDLEDLFSAFGGGSGAGKASIFEDMFGGARRRSTRRPQRQPVQGANLEHTVTLPFEQAAKGATVDVRLTSRNNSNNATLAVKIPPGVEDNQRIRVSGRGQPGQNGGPAGDLIITCHVLPHPYFERSGADLSVDVPISMTEAALGAKIEVPTLDGTAMLTIPAGTEGGSRLRLKEKGLQRKGGRGTGDLLVRVHITSPKNLTAKQRELFEELGQQDGSDPRAECAWNKKAPVT